MATTILESCTSDFGRRSEKVFIVGFSRLSSTGNQYRSQKVDWYAMHIFLVQYVFTIRLRSSMEHQPNLWGESRAMCIQDLVRLQWNITADIQLANVKSFQNTCATLVEKFKDIWIKADKPNTSKVAPKKTVNEMKPSMNEPNSVSNDSKRANLPTMVRLRALCHLI